jgi:RNA polymerase II subunit A small phosphatase-like protein
MAIWSSASEDYVEKCIENFGVLPFRFEFIWDRSRCTRRMDWDTYEEQYIKDLKKVKRRGYSLERTLIVDDSRHKVSRQYGNAVYVKPYEGQQEDRELAYLLRYLQRIKDVDNFRTLEKRKWRTTVEDFASDR